jgi:hypothetical protein
MQFTRRLGVSSRQFQNSVPRSVFSEFQNIVIEVKLDILVPVLWAEFEHKPSGDLILCILPFKDRLQTRFDYSPAFVYRYLIFRVDSNWSCVSIMFLPALCLTVRLKFSVPLIVSMWMFSSTSRFIQETSRFSGLQFFSLFVRTWLWISGRRLDIHTLLSITLPFFL